MGHNPFTMWRLILPLGLFLAAATGLVAQHQPIAEHPAPDEDPADFPHHRIALLLGHTHVPANAEGDGMLIPSWGLDYEYWFNPRWGLGLHTDLELQTFLIDRSGEDLLERDYPLVLTLDALYKPWKGLVIQLGPGYELERNENFYLVRVGLEYEIEMGHRNWDLSPSVFYDTRIDAYDSWSIALGVGKRF